MDAIKKKMQSLKAETDQLKAIIQNFEDETRYHIARAEQADTDIRDYGKKCAKLEFEFDETNEVESDVAALSRRIMLMEEEAKKSEQSLADTVIKLALSSKEADGVLKKVKTVESKCMNNEVTLEELDKNLRQTNKMATDNESKLDELSRKLGVQEDELRRAIDRAVMAETNLKKVSFLFIYLSFISLYVFLCSWSVFVFSFFLSFFHSLSPLFRMFLSFL